jgi:hypothetical protein
MTEQLDQAAYKGLLQAESKFAASPSYQTAEMYLLATLCLAKHSVIGKAEYRKALNAVSKFLE